MMQLRKTKKITQSKPYDIWENKAKGKSQKIHPSTKRNKKTSLPHPGQSYNPDPKDHERLLNKVLRKELEYQQKQQTLNKALKVKIDSRELRKSEKDELEAGIKHLLKNSEDNNEKNHSDDDTSSSTDDAFSDYDDKDFQAIMKDKKVVEKRKSRQQRLKKLKDKLQRKAAKLRKLKNIRLSKFDSIKKMIKELDKQQKEDEEKRRKKHKKKIKNERLGRKFEQSDPIYCLSDELPSSLRQASCPMNAIVKEQLENFQSRLMVEPTSYQIKNAKYKKKQYDRST